MIPTTEHYETVRYFWSECPACGARVRCRESRCLILPFGDVFGECGCGHIITESDYNEVPNETPDL